MLIQPFHRSTVFFSCLFDNPYNDFCSFTSRIGQQLTQMCMVGTFQLIFDHNGIIGSFFRSQYIQAELAYGRFTLTKTQINTDSFAQ